MSESQESVDWALSLLTAFVSVHTDDDHEGDLVQKLIDEDAEKVARLNMWSGVVAVVNIASEVLRKRSQELGVPALDLLQQEIAVLRQVWYSDEPPG